MTNERRPEPQEPILSLSLSLSLYIYIYIVLKATINFIFLFLFFAFCTFKKEQIRISFKFVALLWNFPTLVT